MANRYIKKVMGSAALAVGFRLAFWEGLASDKTESLEPLPIPGSLLGGVCCFPAWALVRRCYDSTTMAAGSLMRTAAVSMMRK